MSTLRNDERMQACLMPSHATIRRQKYYIVRSYYNDLENIFCQGCLQSMAYSHNGNYTVKDGWLFENPQNIFDIADAKKAIEERIAGCT